jgi:hypothetical protein
MGLTWIQFKLKLHPLRLKHVFYNKTQRPCNQILAETGYKPILLTYAFLIIALLSNAGLGSSQNISSNLKEFRQMIVRDNL